MRNKTVPLIALISLFIVFGVGVRKYFFKSWSPYYQEKLYKEPQPLLIEALRFFQDASLGKQALDLGAGAGNDTAYLLRQGWSVWANDMQKEAIRLIASRKDISAHISNLTLIQKEFIDLPWNSFPQFNLIYASYSLPFARSSEFLKIWNHITQALESGGIFAGNFFGPDHGSFNWWIKRKMTFLSKEQLQALFKEFQVLLFEELHEKNKNGVMEHSFNIIAQKL